MHMNLLGYKKLKGNIYEVKFDNGEAYKLYDDIILKYGILIEKTIKPAVLSKMLRENEMTDAYYRALKYIAIKMRSELEIKKYLNRYDFEKASIDYAVSRLKDEGYIDENRYVQAYILDALNLSSDGPKKIENSLRKLGINQEIINNHLSHIDSDTWLLRIKKVLDKKAKVNKNSLAVFKHKTYSSLILLGYEAADINEILGSYFIDTSASFKREADKSWDALSRRYSDVDLVLHFKNRLYSNGFSSDEINDYVQKKGF